MPGCCFYAASTPQTRANDNETGFIVVVYGLTSLGFIYLCVSMILDRNGKSRDLLGAAPEQEGP